MAVLPVTALLILGMHLGPTKGAASGTGNKMAMPSMSGSLRPNRSLTGLQNSCPRTHPSR